MCEPLTIAIAAAAMSAAGTAANYVQGQQNAASTAAAAARNQELQNEQIREQQRQLMNKSANDETERTRAAQQEQAKLRVITGESGALGLTQDRLLTDSAFQQGSDIATIQANRDTELRQTTVNSLANYNQNTSAVNSAYNKAPTLLGTGLQIGTNLGSSYFGYQGAMNKKGG